MQNKTRTQSQDILKHLALADNAPDRSLIQNYLVFGTASSTIFPAFRNSHDIFEHVDTSIAQIVSPPLYAYTVLLPQLV